MGEATFPNEIWMKIFKNIDRRKLMELRLVSRHLYDLIEHHLNKDPEWKDVAFDAIYFPCLIRTMQRTHPYELITFWDDITDPVLWRGTYLSYKKWQKVLVNPETMDTIVPISVSGKISCACTFDKYIAIAFDDGSIANYTTEDISQPFYLAHQSNKINQIEFWYSNGKVLVVTVNEDCALRFWDVQKKVELSTEGLFANIIRMPPFLHRRHGWNPITSYDRVGNHVIAGPTNDLQLLEGEQLIGHATDAKYMAAMAYKKWQNGKDCTRLYLYEGIIESEKLIEFGWMQATDHVRIPANVKASMQRLVMPTVEFFFLIGEDGVGSFNYYDHKWRESKLGQHFGCQVSSMALHAQVLMCGLEDGSVHLLYIDNYSGVRELEEKIKHARKIQVDVVPIRDITVLEVDKKPCIVAITEQRVHLLNFF